MDTATTRGPAHWIPCSKYLQLIYGRCTVHRFKRARWQCPAQIKCNSGSSRTARISAHKHLDFSMDNDRHTCMRTRVEGVSRTAQALAPPSLPAPDVRQSRQHRSLRRASYKVLSFTAWGLRNFIYLFKYDMSIWVQHSLHKGV